MKYSKSFKAWKSEVWYILPLFIFEYNPYCFLETGITTKSLTLGFKWLNFNIGYSIQEGY